ncbi:hypothetical protein FHL15_008612 [Xylaria flabelliformis]|uniref:Ubiquitin-like protease family profile domain-containing protein n=1 Tax=Xylaria flabelliformis TaxID=2512241 RepID=A0A553HR61_9PEZI|nr:hypothetical protein FHL15_008612 [Xylaria flabelliformis]
MASIQHQHRFPVFHSWTIPAHYLQCSFCREQRRYEVQRQQRQAHSIGRMVAINVGQRPRHRVFNISPRLHGRNPRLRRLAQDEEEELYPVTPIRRVTIQVPSLDRPVHTDSPIGLPLKRPRSFDNNPDPAQYLVPEQLYPRAGVDFWAANSEAIRLGSPVPTPAESSPTSTVAGHFELSMPGTWPSWADEPNPVPPPVAPRPHIQLDDPAENAANPDTNGLFTFFGGLSALVLGALRVVRWRVAEPVQPTPATQPAQPAQPLGSTITTTAPTTAVTQAPQTVQYGSSRTTKRPRLDEGSSHQRRFSRCGPSYPSNGRPAFLGPSYDGPPNRIPTHFRRDGRAGSSSNKRTTSYESIAPTESPKIDETDPNFNHAGHFSLDAIDTSDSEDEEYPGSPMDIDSPEPIVSQSMETILAREPIPMDIDLRKPIVSIQTEAILARQPIEPRYTQSKLKLDELTPIALDKTEAILAPQPIDGVDGEPRPKLDPATAAARRAVKFFPKDSPSPKARVSPSAKRNVGAERRHKVAAVLTSPDTSPDKTEKARYDDILEFFPNDIVHSLPGLGDESLPADGEKVEHLKRELRERLRREEVETQNALLSHLGVRRAKATLITKPSSEWVNRALDAPRSGCFDPKAVHPDAVELKPRDFAKLVPPTAWLNDDCVHSTLCCLAAYINKKAGVKSKLDPPKCVAVSSLYWKAFCGDHKKLYPRPFSRKWNMTPDNFLKVDTILIPVNSNAHWTLIAIRPSRRTVSYLDSFHHRNDAQLRHAYQWLQLFLGDKFVFEDWETKEFSSPQQTNAWDCGMFVITNAMCLALGISPMCYDEEKMPIQRQRIAAMLLNGGFSGEFDLSHL